MRLTGPVAGPFEGPEDWIQKLQAKGYTLAASLPVGPESGEGTIQAYLGAAEKAGIGIAEVGAWSSPISEDDAFRTESMAKCKRQLAFADRIGARCCVNIAGSRGSKWDGPDPRDLTDETFELIVATVQEIIDDVQPENTWYTLEPMPWMFPCDTETYLDLIEAIDRDRFAVHFDPVNMINSPFRFFYNGQLIENFIEKLGPWIRSVHAKDITLAKDLTVHLSETVPGRGQLDYKTLLKQLDQLDPDLPLVLEHCATPEEYDEGADFIRKTAGQMKIRVG
ncbi:MAG: sugar phosphate isomerase/epimerase family protein [Phycisphaerae bacterium]